MEGVIFLPEIKYKRILLKISGEALAGDAHRGLDFEIVNFIGSTSKSYYNTHSHK